LRPNKKHRFAEVLFGFRVFGLAAKRPTERKAVVFGAVLRKTVEQKASALAHGFLLLRQKWIGNIERHHETPLKKLVLHTQIHGQIASGPALRIGKTAVSKIAIHAAQRRKH
jgi:hypothetical protein